MHICIAFLAGILATVGLLFIFSAFLGVQYYGLTIYNLVFLAIIIFVLVAIALWLFFAGAKAQYERVKTGKEFLIGSKGIANTNIKPKGEVRVLGEFWQAVVQEGEISKDQVIEVVGLEGMFLIVKTVEQKA